MSLYDELFIQTRVSERLHRLNAFHLSVNPLIFYSLIDLSEPELIPFSGPGDTFANPDIRMRAV
jgi:hypothetical protein